MPSEPLTCYEKRRASTEARLRAAVEKLEQSGRAPISVSALARESGVSRAAIYNNHRTILAALNCRPPRDANAPPPRASKEPSALAVTELAADLQKLAGENALLLKRALDAEQQVTRLSRRIAELLRTMNGAQGVSVLHGVEP
jgi:hypothetical protein